ncbi:hypothetical protein MD588_07975, partial [Photobacterium sp. SDRW27]|uniref:hypothetical protein n=1 Tax=Photobacterium obscurum TaxID=2829490 RepID=UPI0022435A3E
MNVEELEKLIGNISDKLVSENLPSDWIALKLECRHFDDDTNLTAYYRDGLFSKWQTYRLDNFGLDIFELCGQLIKATQDTEVSDWTMLTVKRTMEGKFSYEFSYGDPGIYDYDVITK